MDHYQLTQVKVGEKNKYIYLFFYESNRRKHSDFKEYPQKIGLLKKPTQL